MTATSALVARVLNLARAWWRDPRPTWWGLAVLAALLALRKSSALLTPPLWAEDGSIFLAQNDQLGLRALIEPYMGYLHTLPRLIALAASHVADPAWWPLIYNSAAGAITLVVIATMFSPRLPLAAKPALALAFLLGARTGEVLFNVTNLQFVSAAALLQVLLKSRPCSAFERAGDLAMLGLVGSTGPFSIIFAPLFAWRWWRNRHLDHLAALLVVAGCAGTQCWFVLHGPAASAGPLEIFHPVKFLSLTASRLIAWPLVGEWAVRLVSLKFVALFGGALLVAVAWRTVRPHPLRSVRVPVALTLVLLIAAAAYRVRFDTWQEEDFDSGDRYFYLPRVLLIWLVAWELDASSRAVRQIVRGALALCVATLIPGYCLPTPPDYRWAEHCDPIRRGVPANIPTLPEGWKLEYPGRPPPR